MARYLSLAEAAKQIGQSAGTLRNAAIAGTLKAVKIGRNWAVTPAALERYATRERHAGGRPPKH